MEKEHIVSTAWSSDTDIRVIETLYHNANGYLGVRNSPEDGEWPGSIRGTYLNGFYELMDVQYGEKLYGFPEIKQTIVNVPDAQTVALEADGERCRLRDASVESRTQEIDIEAGVSRRAFLWRTAKGTLSVKVDRVTPFDLPGLFLMDYTVSSVDYAGPIRLLSSLNADVRNHAASDDPRVAAEPLRCLATRRKGVEKDSAYVDCATLRSGLTLACRVSHACPWPLRWQEETLTAVAEGALAPGESVTLTKFAVYSDSLHTPDPLAETKKLLAEAMALGSEEIKRMQRSRMAAFQQDAFIRLDAPGILPKALTYDLFELLQSTGTDGICNVASKGLSGEGYEGHIFWDSEIYVFPFFLWTQPEKARNLLAYRYRHLDQARSNAKLAGIFRGALFPWRTISGDECSAFFPAGTAQYHINGDIAYAFIQYWYAAQDVDFLAEMGAEVLVETARAWLELGHMDGDVFRIDCVTGPDEYTCLVNNNFYTNAVAKYNLQGAADAMAELTRLGLDAPLRKKIGVTEEEEAAFRQAAEAMYLPYDEKLGISPQDDSFLHKKKLDWRSLPREQFPLLLHYHPLFLYRYQVCKQADTVLAHLLFPDYASPEAIRKSWHYYNDITTHDSSLSHCVFAMGAARLGDMEQALKGFEETAVLDLLDTHGNTKDGLHTASLGGAYLSLLMGFAGIRSGAEGLSLAPTLPEGWGGYAIPFRYRGRKLLLQAAAGQEPELALLEGEPLTVNWFGREKTLGA